jgi:Uma2 family endonuclease
MPERTAQTMPVATRVMTADELFRLPDDGYPCELVKGVLRKKTPAGFDHGAIIMNLSVPLAQHVRSHNLGVVCGAETGFRLASDPDTVRAPDIAFVRRDRLPASGRPTGFWPGAPDLAVEVLSPSDTVFDVDEKVAAWLAAGAAAVWIVNPRRQTVTIQRSAGAARTFSDQDTLDGEDIVSEFRLPIAEIFA